ncbi:MAG: LytTR family DNA-binding domain-containing protein [Bacteroidales bacterium]
MNIRCVAIDDEPLALKLIEDYIRQTPSLELSEKFTNPVKAFNYLSENETDLLFIDIHMPDLSGLDIVSKLNHKPVLIFTTAYSEYAIEGFKADAIDYLLKPIDYPDFLKAVNKAKELILAKSAKNVNIQSSKDFLFIKSEYKIIRLNFSDIKYIQGMSEYVRIHLTTGKPIMSLLSLKSIETQLPEELFMRVHKSFIVNLQKVNVIERNEIVYDDGVVIPVSQQYKQKFQEYLEKNFLL